MCNFDSSKNFTELDKAPSTGNKLNYLSFELNDIIYNLEK